jgi:hypothetical protein
MKKSNIYDKILVIPVENDMWKSIRQIAFNEEISMSKLARIAFKKIIVNYEKKLQNTSNIV